MKNIENLENLGRVPENYDNSPRSVQSVGLIKTPNLVLKVYQMFCTHKGPYENQFVEKNKTFLEGEIIRGIISPDIGVGFAKIGHEVLNAVKWDKKVPILMKEDIYDISKGFQKIKKMDAQRDGPFCLWEARLAVQESRLWEKYLNSEISLKNYLTSFSEGPL